MVCAQLEQESLAPLVADLPGLVVTSDIALDDVAGIRELIVAHSLDERYALQFERDQLVLCKADNRGRFGRDRVSLQASDLQRRSGTLTELQRACFGQSPGAGVQVLDVFAGWGMDAWALASRGARVTCVELQPVMVALLRDFARRVPTELASRIEVLHGNAFDFLQELKPGSIDVIYLDPMFPTRKKGALPNKRLQWLADLAGSSSFAVDELIALAVRKAAKQVVLKRRRKDPVISDPVRQVVGSSVRYDIYAAYPDSSL